MRSEGDSPAIMRLRDRGLVIAGWVFGTGGVVGAIVAMVAGAPAASAPLALVAAWNFVMRLYDIPRVELYADHLLIHSFTTTAVPYAEIVGTRVDHRWWAGRSALYLERGFDHETPVPAGFGLGPPRWHLELRDELNRRVPHELM